MSNVVDVVVQYVLVFSSENWPIMADVNLSTIKTYVSKW